MLAGASAVFACADVRVTEGIEFGRVGDYTLYGDMYVPGGDGPFPGILYIHGGGFLGGDKLRPVQVDFYHLVAEQGYTVFSINYRLIQEGGVFPNCIRDVKTGLAWMRAHSDEYKIDPARTGVIGMSAGAHLAAMIAFTPNVPFLQPEADELEDADTSVDAAVLFYPPTNLATFESSISRILMFQIKKESGITSPGKFKAYLEKYSPVTHVKKEPPVFLSYSIPDGIVATEQQLELVDRMEEVGTEFEHVPVSGEGIDHGFIVIKPDTPQSAEVREKMFEFLEKHVKNRE